MATKYYTRLSSTLKSNGEIYHFQTLNLPKLMCSADLNTGTISDTTHFSSSHVAPFQDKQCFYTTKKKKFIT